MALIADPSVGLSIAVRRGTIDLVE